MPTEQARDSGESTGYDGLNDMVPEGHRGGYLDPDANNVIFE